MKKQSIYKKMRMLHIFIVLSGFLIFTVYAMVNDNHAISIIPMRISQEAYSEFLTQLPIDEDGDYVYPSTFSGAYLDKETYALCIALTDCSDDVQEQYDHFLSDPSIVVYKEAEPFRKL